MDKWFGKIAVVTGASVGIGKDISLRLVEHGLKVVGCGRDLNKLTLVKYDISNNAKGEFFPFKCDVSKEEDVLNLFNYIKTTFKELSILINNAGVAFDVRHFLQLIIFHKNIRVQFFKARQKTGKLCLIQMF